jgi:hypothetical protein
VKPKEAPAPAAEEPKGERWGVQQELPAITHSGPAPACRPLSCRLRL